MPSIRITTFAGILPELNRELLRKDHAQIAHNALLWDGWLRPMPEFTFSTSANGMPFSLVERNKFGNDTVIIVENLDQAVHFDTEGFLIDTFVGISNNLLSYSITPIGPVYPLGLPQPNVGTVTQVINPQNKSVYPISRTYAVTFMSGSQEGPPSVLPQLGGDGTLFEGDVVTFDFTGVPSPAEIAQYNITGRRLYRTIPGFDTSEELGNPKETEFHLVSTQSFNMIVDDLDSSLIMGDLLLTEQFLAPSVVPHPFGDFFVDILESGSIVAAGYMPNSSINTSTIQFSEKFQWHAWPPQYYVQIPEYVIDLVTFYDDVFVGTKGRPYHIRVEPSSTEEGVSMNINVRPFPDYYACQFQTMVRTNFGAMYACRDGLIALSANDDSVSTKKVANPGDILQNPIAPIRFNDALRAIWWNGFYIGFTEVGVAYLFNVDNTNNNQFPLGQLVTITTPDGFPGPNKLAGENIYASWGLNIYSLPLPGYGYTGANKLSYTWKSKRFVLPGLTTFSAAKVVHDASGPLQFTLIGDDVVIMTTAVTDSEPFRVPHQHRCIEWEVVLEGTSVVQEVHVATSMRELVEEQGHG